jgi:membrane-associated phospholipid phosphatase
VHQLYDWFGLNVALFHLINQLHAGWWDACMLAMTWLGDHEQYPSYMVMALLFTYWRPRVMPLRNVVVFAAGYVLTALVVTALKPYLDLPRPLLALGRDAVVVVGMPEYHHSFPSGHATFAVLLAASLAPRTARPMQWGAWLFAALVCLSRVSVGAHFPADVLGGALIGLIAVGVASAVLRVRTDRTETM